MSIVAFERWQFLSVHVLRFERADETVQKELKMRRWRRAEINIAIGMV
jgi:hypothetical protein